MTNRQRAAAGRAALNTFTGRVYGGRKWKALHPDDQVTAIYDLLCDLMHTARLEGHFDTEEELEPQALWESAMRHYEVEAPLDWDEEDHA